MSRYVLDHDSQALRPLGVRSTGRSSRASGPIWGRWVLMLAILVLGIGRWQLEGYLPESYALWWRSAYVLTEGEAVDPVLGLYPVSLPLFHGLTQGILRLSAWIGGHHSLVGLKLMATIVCLWVGLWCWGRGSFWSFGLWGLSPWVIELGLDPHGEVLAALLLFLGSVTLLPQRFLWLGLACGISFKAWPIALILAFLWTGQSWPRYRFLGVYVVLGSIALTAIWIRTWPWLGPPHVSPLPQMPIWQILAGILAPLLLSWGLVVVRMMWPWNQRQQAGIGLGVSIYLGVGIPLLWLSGWRGELWVETSARMALIVLPLLAYVAGGVLMEIGSVRWRRLLGVVLLVASFALSWQSVTLWSNRLLLLQPAQAAAQWLQMHRDQIAAPVVVDSAAIAYLSDLPVQNLISSGAAEKLYGDSLAEPVEWLVINQAEPQAWGRSSLLQHHPEFAQSTEIAGWDLVYINQEIIPPISEIGVNWDNQTQIASLSRPAIGVPIIQIWRRSPSP